MQNYQVKTHQNIDQKENNLENDQKLTLITSPKISPPFPIHSKPRFFNHNTWDSVQRHVQSKWTQAQSWIER